LLIDTENIIRQEKGKGNHSKKLTITRVRRYYWQSIGAWL